VKSAIALAVLALAATVWACRVVITAPGALRFEHLVTVRKRAGRVVARVTAQGFVA
jgi:hypothetical protein